MKTAVLTRRYSEKATNGIIEHGDFKLFTVELPDKDNQARISCIPEGEYDVVWSESPRLKKFTYEIIGVKDRAGIRIHPANFAHQLKGCIAPGLTEADIDGDGVLDVTSSRVATEKLEDYFNRETFKLIIRS